MDSGEVYDVLVVGGGNAALCAALSARTAGASVLVLEAAPRHFRGGNSRHTRNLRCMHDAPSDGLTGVYPESDYWKDLLDVTGEHTDEQLAKLTIRESATVRDWMASQGVRFQPSLGGTLHLSRTNAFFLGGGKALLNAYYRTAARMGIRIEYEAEVRDLEVRDGRFRSATIEGKMGRREVSAKTLIAASGGIQANLDWLKETWGPAADNFIVRGTPYAKGTVLRRLTDRGADTVRDATECHAIAVDARAPRFDGGIVTRVDSVSLGIVVNRDAQRFYDEGEDFWPKRYAIWGRIIAKQPEQIAYSIIDSKSAGKFMPPVFPPLQANSIRELAMQLPVAPDALERTVQHFNASVRPSTFDHTALDDCRTEALTPPKSHWARPLDTPPFYAYPLRPGITFTYYGVAVNAKAQVLFRDKPSENVFAAGEIMAGNILGKGYLAGLGMTIGTVFGRIAGREAACRVLG